MGFFTRRRQSQSQRQLADGVEMLDSLVESPLKDALGQEIRVAVEQRLGENWQMQGFWSGLGVDHANKREDVNGEDDAYAFTDGLVLGYVWRWVESERSDTRPVPGDVAVRLAALGLEEQAGVLQTVIDVASSRLPEIQTLTGEAWSEFEYWAWQLVAKQSRERRRSSMRTWVDLSHAMAFGYALRCCEEVATFGHEPDT